MVYIFKKENRSIFNIYTTKQMFTSTLNCFSKFIITNFTTDHEVQNELPKNKQELVMHLYTA